LPGTLSTQLKQSQPVTEMDGLKGIQEVASSILVSSTTERTPFSLIFLDLP
jgi:hypothetical protein